MQHLLHARRVGMHTHRTRQVHACRQAAALQAQVQLRAVPPALQQRGQVDLGAVQRRSARIQAGLIQRLVHDRQQLPAAPIDPLQPLPLLRLQR